MLAVGAGISPMIRILNHVFSDPNSSIRLNFVNCMLITLRFLSNIIYIEFTLYYKSILCINLL